MKKILSVILCGAIALSIASCSGSDAKPASGTDVTTSSGATEKASVSTDADFSPDFTFKTTDRAGNTYDESIFASAKLTMINFWEPWCGPCVKEMPELQKLYETYRDRGFRILGVYSDFEYEEEMRQVVEQTGVQYPILEYVDVFNQFQTGYVPTTIFVDGSGHVVGETMIGSGSYDDWAAVVEELLK